MPRPWAHTSSLSSLDWKWSHLWSHLYSGEYISSENGNNSAGKGAGAPYTLEFNMERDSDHSLFIMDNSGKIVWNVGVKKEYELHCLTIEDDGRVILSDTQFSSPRFTKRSSRQSRPRKSATARSRRRSCRTFATP
ncbi:hypothetical protein AMAG_06655 [Allomyces macrogynus ATCC 38327]|uniref:Bulb-type lectin domain-containing protein n=1 Tax=Allomyces macrogynus (strain ATCC 38327) TaxID=578462 RepID=A0A0L0SEM8_ALLM3|nr:hypothetical protein AMAG_06655 [Allomyces macrogynus ATCC 38327]|eukprot:KNE60894.1 hypothetical protein AMAG_06655 [Allomyces macrogynus ATCC 38327]